MYQKNITSLGTMQINQKGIPTEIKDVKQREPLARFIAKKMALYCCPRML